LHEHLDAQEALRADPKRLAALKEDTVLLSVYLKFGSDGHGNPVDKVWFNCKGPRNTRLVRKGPFCTMLSPSKYVFQSSRP
jgi:hypothetical protein